MLKENTITRSAEMSASRSTVGWLIAISVAAGLAIWMAPPYLFSEDIVPVVVVAALFALLLVIVLGLAITRHQPAKVTVYRLTLLMWWVILVCEAVFVPNPRPIEINGQMMTAAQSFIFRCDDSGRTSASDIYKSLDKFFCVDVRGLYEVYHITGHRHAISPQRRPL